MKKLLLLAVFGCLTFLAQAQLPAGSTAPNFTAVDLNGRTWTLYDILESGRPVIMDVSATWCGPCWSYHNGGALETFYAAHGPEGDGKAMVMFVEGDGSTNLNCLYGSAGCVGGTQGNWVQGTPYPMFDNADIANAYNIAYFPTIYLIHPDKTVEELNQLSATALWNKTSPFVGNIPQNWGKISKFDTGARTLQFCGKQTITPSFDFTNLGTSEITSIEAELRWNGTVIQTVEFEGDIKVLDLESIVFDAFDVTSVGTLTAEITKVNGVENGQPSVSEVNFVEPPVTYQTNQVEVRIRTDNNAKDIYWAAYDDNNVLIAEGGNLLVGPNGGGQFPGGSPSDPSAYPNNANRRDTLNIPSTCFSFLLVDGAGNGLVAPGNIRLLNMDGTNFRGISGNFGARFSEAFAESTVGINDVNHFSSLTVAPNPAAETMVVTYDLGVTAKVNLTVMNAIGQVVYERKGAFAASGEQQSEISVAQYANGLYYLQLKAEDGSMVAKPFVVAH